MATPLDRTSPLGRAIRSERTSQGLTRQTLAARAGVSEPTVARIELYGQEPSLTTLGAIASALGVQVSVLMDEQATA